MSSDSKQTVTISPKVAKYIGAKASRENKLKAASMQAEFTLKDTLIMLCYLGRDSDEEISSQARKNLIPAARKWHSRPDEERPELPDPIEQIVLKVIERIGEGKGEETQAGMSGLVSGNIGLLGLGEIIQTVDHNSRTVAVHMEHDGQTSSVYMMNGKVVGAVFGETTGLDALYKAFGWGDANFRYAHEGPGEFNQGIKVNTLNLVMDALEHSPEDDPFFEDSAKEWIVKGDLKILNLFEISEIFEMNSKQCICDLVRKDKEGRLYFNQGRIVNATLEDMTGMDAACHLLAWPNATFTIRKGGEEIEEVIHVGMQNLIIEAMRLFDEGVTSSEDIAQELAAIDELFDGKDLFALPILDKVRAVFSDDANTRDALETDGHPLVRKAIKVKISKTVHKYLNPNTPHDIRLQAAKGKAPLSTTEKLVLLSYLSHDEEPDIKETAKNTLAMLDIPTYRKGMGSDLHPAVMDFLVRETIQDPAIVGVACSSENIQEDTAIYALDRWKSDELLKIMVDNTKLMEKSPAFTQKLYNAVQEIPELKEKIEIHEQGLLEGNGELKAEGPLMFCGIRNLLTVTEQGSRTATVIVEGNEGKGEVYMEHGKILGAVMGDLQGREALEKIIADPGMKFRYVLRSLFHVHNIEHTKVEDIINLKEAGPITVDTSKVAAASFLTGSLQAMDVYELLYALEGTPIPMRISVKCEEGAGEIYRDATRILHCKVDGKETPAQGMASLMTWNGLRFIVSKIDGDFEKTIDKNVSDFVTDAIAELTEEVSKIKNPGELPEWELSEEEYESLYFKILNMGVADKIKLATLGNKEARSILVRDSKKMVAVAVIKSPKITISEVESISNSRQVCDDVLRQIAGTKEFMRSYTVKLNLVNNAKTPVPISMRLLNQIRELDLRKIAKSKAVPQAIATQARRIAESKGGN